MKYKFFSRYIDKTVSYKSYKDFLFFEQNYWNDYNYETIFEVYKPLDSGKLIKLGSINIANINASNTELYKAFEEFSTEKSYDNLSGEFISLGNDEYYWNLHKYFNKDECKIILQNLNDICLNYDENNKEIFFHHDVVKTSFFRGYTEEEAIKKVEYILKPLANDGNREGYNITYTYSLNDKIITEINFNADSERVFPQNVHAIIGNNGSGKTTFIKDILTLAIKQELLVKSQFKKNDERFDISFSSLDDIKIDSPKDYFSKVVLISFSPFDSLYLRHGEPIGDNGNVTYLGLYQNGENPLNYDDLFNTFSDLIIRLKDNRDNWLFFKEILETQDFHGDILPIVSDLDTEVADHEVSELYSKIFKKMSAGQKIIILSIATLITEVEQFNLVLIDEPELFLHPPMISNYIRSISKIMRRKNGLCILTTHSPIIVQEIPKDCVKIIQPNDEGGIKMIEPEYETLGENLSTLTNTIFGLDQYKSGFYLLIEDIINNPENYKNSKEDIEDLKFGRDGMLYRSLLLSEVDESEDE
jgi:hypothetical protein